MSESMFTLTVRLTQVGVVHSADCRAGHQTLRYCRVSVEGGTWPGSAVCTLFREILPVGSTLRLMVATTFSAGGGDGWNTSDNNYPALAQCWTTFNGGGVKSGTCITAYALCTN